MFHKRIAQLTMLAAICFIAQQTFFGMSILNRSTAIIIIVFLFASLRTMQIKSFPRWVQSLDKCSMGIYIVRHIAILEMNDVAYFKALACEYCFIR